MLTSQECDPVILWKYPWYWLMHRKLIFLIQWRKELRMG